MAKGLHSRTIVPALMLVVGTAAVKAAATSTLPQTSETTFWMVAAAILAVSLCVTIVALTRLNTLRLKTTAATHGLARMAQCLKAGEPSDWIATGVADVDDIARTLEEFEQRLRRKRTLLTRLNAELIRGAGVGGSTGFNNQLRAIIDALPVGVLIAEAPNGRILEGNTALETIRRGPVIYSEGVEAYRGWTAVHDNGEPVLQDEYPLARALAGEERPVLECRLQRGDGTWSWVNITGAPIRDEEGEIMAAIVAVTDINELRSAEEHRRMMNLELHHRVNNSLAMIQGIANITARTATDFACFRNSFSDRIQCLSRISTLLVKKSWAQTPMKELATAALASDTASLRDRIETSGDDVELRSEVALALGMALHELLSNAERHGALSTENGKVFLEWRVTDSEGHHLQIDWRERGGPPVAGPQRAGVGQYLMKSVLTRQFGGDIDIAFEPEGVRATITAEI
ncbi:HWE histidine kinase domain-containing protein [Methylocystis parvus]|uniref:Blue-light-activated histidine kinase n=1 Tax=Methylocystis parvus TaxID=134 RepID=A0A6B8M921_9HYPH|nr:HWE histidine kinase domain-containing protein [Methylocystis parvus]QGM97220.1 PAS domain S-box protein [Methylocystis parvus]WBJ98873.1 PAS domain S-box protein [Methylocystis parvus OBBP]